MDKILGFFSRTSKELLGINDNPHKIALGFAVGVFLGILPFTGVVAAAFLAAVFKYNAASALIGSLLTNTWLSIVSFVAAIKIGSAVLGRDGQVLLDRFAELISHFTWKNLVASATVDLLIPLLIGYVIIGIACGLLSYVVIYLIFKARRGS